MESEGWAGEGVELSSSEAGRLCVCLYVCMFIFQNDFTTTIIIQWTCLGVLR